MLGPLHIEMMVDCLIGDWLQGIGWVESLAKAGIVTEGRGDGVLKSAHVTRARYCHQVSAFVLSILMDRAYEAYRSETRGDQMSFEDWQEDSCRESYSFNYWKTAYELELLLLKFVRSIRTGNFKLYIQVLTDILPWCFVLDHQNYARWLSVHVRDMVNLEHMHPELFNKFCEGFFVVNKTQNPFSMIGLDHNHEQANRTVKEEGGSFYLEGKECVLTEALIAGPERARLITEFESLLEKNSKPSHHDATLSVQRNFLTHVQDLMGELSYHGNPFCQSESIALQKNSVLPESVGESMQLSAGIGKEQYNEFVTERLEQRSKAIDYTISSNRILRPGNLPSEKKQGKPHTPKDDLHLIGKLYIALESREGNADKLFRHENTAIPPSLSRNSRLRGGSKSDLVTCIEDDYAIPRLKVITDQVDVEEIDGASMVHKERPSKTIATFEDYANQVIIPHIVDVLQTADEADILWDLYFDQSLKENCRENRGTGQRTRVQGTGPIPPN